MYIRFSFFLVSVLLGCKQNVYDNKPIYELAPNETCSIYLHTNSCCYHCIENLDALNHISLVEKKRIEKSAEDCAGCNEWHAFIFKASSVGIDTIKIKEVPASKSCEDGNTSSVNYVIKVMNK